MTEDFSLHYAKKNKKILISSITEGKDIEEEKIAIFMAGSPGAGKTEVAQTLMALNNNLCIIDADKFRALFPGYIGNNSDEFQRGKERFINAFFQSRKNLIHVKEEFQERVTINVLVKDFQNTISDFLMDIDNITLTLPINYTKHGLEEELLD
ncbi:zeta toxin family protein [Enterococcus canintestini]|uniref:zeta toxin family protein n=1 Tax=Enterococcus canintestini TaxID=317010 RepID=UPI002891AAFA|nr:zeta toxin family protein [Enterococcus canintestini]MDT2740441.1 zeta toxin family protein [Enterococcus canintestini]